MMKLKCVVSACCLFGLGLFTLACAGEKGHQNQTTPQMQTDSSTEFFRFAPDRNQSIQSGVIASNLRGSKPEKIPLEIITAIKKNPGLETGGGFRSPLNLESTDQDCELSGFKIQLSEQADVEQWLVAPEPPCGKYKYAQLNSPFWLVEQKKGDKPEVLLAYRAYTLSIETQKHEEYADINITYQSPLDGNDIDINWRYHGQTYTYHTSMCSNLNSVDANEPAFFTDCAPVERWSTQTERE